MARLKMNEGWHSDPEFEYEYPKYDNGTAILQRMNRAKPRIRNVSNFRNSLTINIDSRKVGRLIGKGGCNIKELEEKSKARIKIEESDTCGISIAILIGSQTAQNKAKELIEELLKNLSSPARAMRKKEGGRSHEEFDLHGLQRYKEQKSFIYPPIYKNFYIEDPIIARMSAKDVADMRLRNNNIEVRRISDGKASNVNDRYYIPNPIETFEQAFHNYPQILREIRKQGFKYPSPIQSQAWPILLSGKDMIGIAQTGTGKTLAFLLPALIHIDGQRTPFNKRVGPNVLVLAPTRELALQIEKEVGKYSYRNIKAVCLYGGSSRQDQIDIVTKGVQIVIATPGRLNDLVVAQVVDIRSVTYLVLDEADRMLDMGFEPQIRKILLEVRSDRQTIMTSATWPPGVRRLAGLYMKDPIQVFVGSLNLSAVHTVKQHIYIIDEDDKLPMFYEFIRNMEPEDKVIAFLCKKARVDHISSELARSHILCDSIHGGRDQDDRERAIEDFKTGTIRILIATDVVSRGIDIEDITHVFNFDFPRDMEEYVHRVGRTGRAGKSGVSITFMTKDDWSHAEELINILGEANQMVPDELYRMAQRYKAWRTKQAKERAAIRANRSGGVSSSSSSGVGGSGFYNKRWEVNW